MGTISGSPQQERREEQFYSLPSRGRRRNQIIKCEKQRRKRERGRTFLHHYLPEATCSGVELASWASGGRIQPERTPRHGNGSGADRDKKGWHGSSMLHLANTDGCQGPLSQACPLGVAPRPSEPRC